MYKPQCYIAALNQILTVNQACYNEDIELSNEVNYECMKLCASTRSIPNASYIIIFGGLVVSTLATGTRVGGSNPAEATGFFGRPENPQYAFLRRGSKRICPMSQLCGM